MLGLKESRAKAILQGLSGSIDMVGSNRDRRYKKKEVGKCEKSLEV